jgi:hypothetical protein
VNRNWAKSWLLFYLTPMILPFLLWPTYITCIWTIWLVAACGCHNVTKGWRTCGHPIPMRRQARKFEKFAYLWSSFSLKCCRKINFYERLLWAAFHPLERDLKAEHWVFYYKSLYNSEEKQRKTAKFFIVFGEKQVPIMKNPPIGAKFWKIWTLYWIFVSLFKFQENMAFIEYMASI